MEGQRIVCHVPYWFGILGVRTRRWQIRAAAFHCKSKRYGQVRFLPCQGDRASVREKLLQLSCVAPYRKPTQVDRASSPRGTSDSSLRNSAKKRPYLRYKAYRPRALHKEIPSNNFQISNKF